MPNNGTQFVPPAYDVTNVLFGIGYLLTAPSGTPLPADIDLGDSSKWLTMTPTPWTYHGSTDQGVQNQFNPNMNDINIEEQVTPAASLVNTATFQITTAMAEETIDNINFAYGAGGTKVVTAAATGQPGKTVLNLSSNFKTLAAAILGKNKLGFPRVFYVPLVNSAGQVQTNFRRAADKRMYPVTLNALCDLSQIQIIDITAAGL